jgi:hypothetical protein
MKMIAAEINYIGIMTADLDRGLPIEAKRKFTKFMSWSDSSCTFSCDPVCS